MVDIIINNAAQTIRRPMAYFHSLLEYEKLKTFSGAVKLIGRDPTHLIDYTASSTNNAYQNIIIDYF